MPSTKTTKSPFTVSVTRPRSLLLPVLGLLVYLPAIMQDEFHLCVTVEK